MTPAAVERTFGGYEGSDLAFNQSGGSYHRIFVKLRWAKGNDQIWVVYENSRVAAKWMQAMSDPYPISDFPEFKVAELN